MSGIVVPRIVCFVTLGLLYASCSDGSVPDSSTVAATAAQHDSIAEWRAGAETWVALAKTEALDDMAIATCVVNVSPLYRVAADSPKHVRILSVVYDITVDGVVLARSSVMREMDAGRDEERPFSSPIDLRALDILRNRNDYEETEDAVAVRNYAIFVRPSEGLLWGDVTDKSHVSVMMSRSAP